MNINNSSSLDCTSILKKYILGIPFFSRCICATVLLLSIISLALSGALAIHMVNYPPLTINKVQVWRLFSSPWISYNLSDIIVGGIMFLIVMPDIEKRIGSFRFLIKFLILGRQNYVTTLGLIYESIFALCGAGLQRWHRFIDGGFAFAYLVEFTNYCFRNPNSQINCCMCIPVKAVFMPFIFILMPLIFGQIPLRECLCVLLGFLDSKEYLKFLIVSARLGHKADAFFKLSYFQSYIKTSQSYSADSILAAIFPSTEAQPPSRPQSTFETFSGRGVSLSNASHKSNQAIIEIEPKEPRTIMSAQDRERVAKSVLIKKYEKKPLDQEEEEPLMK